MKTQTTIDATPDTLALLSYYYERKPQGAFAELVQNSMQAHAKKCVIDTIKTIKSDNLYILDDGHGMSQEEVRKSAVKVGHFGNSDCKALAMKGVGLKAAIFALCTDALLVTKKFANCFTIAGFSMSQNSGHQHFKVPIVMLVNNQWQNEQSPDFAALQKHFGLSMNDLRKLCKMISSATGTMIVLNKLKKNVKLDESHCDVLFPKANQEDVHAVTSLHAYCEMMYFTRSMNIKLFGQQVNPLDFSILQHKLATIEVSGVTFLFATNAACAKKNWSGINLYTKDGKSVYCFEKCSDTMRPGVIAYAFVDKPVQPLNKLEFSDPKEVQQMMLAAYQAYIAEYPSKYKVKSVPLPIAIVKQSQACAKRPRNEDIEEEGVLDTTCSSTCKKPRLVK